MRPSMSSASIEMVSWACSEAQEAPQRLEGLGFVLSRSPLSRSSVLRAPEKTPTKFSSLIQATQGSELGRNPENDEIVQESRYSTVGNVVKLSRKYTIPYLQLFEHL